jgi:hypothetical protein
MRSLLLRENSLLWSGDSLQTGVYGMVNHPATSTPTNLPSSVAWDNGATAAEIYSDLVFMTEYISANTSLVYKQPVTLLLPWEAYRIANSKQFSAASDLTVMQYFMRNQAVMVAGVFPVRELDTAKVAIAYIRDPDICGNLLVNDVFQYEPQRYAGGYSVDYQLDTGGFVVIDSNGIRSFDQILT